MRRSGSAETGGNGVIVSGGLDGFDGTLYGGYAGNFVANAVAGATA